MATEREKMLAGELYDAFDPELVALRVRARELCRDLNASAVSDAEHRRALLLDLFGAGGDTALVEPPFHCDYGANIRLGARTVIGAGSVVTRDVPPDVFAAGNPCRVVRAIP